MTTQSLPTRKFDVVIVGAGGSGMRASLQLSLAGLNVALVNLRSFGPLQICVVVKVPVFSIVGGLMWMPSFASSRTALPWGRGVDAAAEACFSWASRLARASMTTAPPTAPVTSTSAPTTTPAKIHAGDDAGLASRRVGATGSPGGGAEAA